MPTDVVVQRPAESPIPPGDGRSRYCSAVNDAGQTDNDAHLRSSSGRGWPTYAAAGPSSLSAWVAGRGGEFRPRPFLAWPSAQQRVRSRGPRPSFPARAVFLRGGQRPDGGARAGRARGGDACATRLPDGRRGTGFPRSRRGARPVRVRLDGGGDRADQAGDRPGAHDYGPWRLRLRRRLLDRDPGSSAARAGCELRLVHTRPARRRIWADPRRSGAAGRPWHGAAIDGRLRDHLPRRGRGRPCRRHGGDRHRSPRARRAASGLPTPSPPPVGLPVRGAVRDGSCPQALRGPPRRGARGRRTSTWWRWRRSPTWFPCGARTAPSFARAFGWRARRAGRGSGPCAPRQGFSPSASTRAISPFASARGSTPRVVCIAPTPASS